MAALLCEGEFLVVLGDPVSVEGFFEALGVEVEIGGGEAIVEAEAHHDSFEVVVFVGEGFGFEMKGEVLFDGSGVSVGMF